MRWWGGRESSNVEYGSGGGGKMIVGGSIGSIIIGLIVYLLSGGTSSDINLPGSNQQVNNEQPAVRDSADHFIRVVLAQTDDVWTAIFKKAGSEYQQPTLHIFEGNVQSACGYASAATGPFYCPGDEKVYLDKSFFRELKERFHAPGDFANGYVIAHEVGHHVQRLLGTTEKVQQQMSGADKRDRNRLSVMLELQADFYAGIWAHYINERGDVVEPGDIESALNAASAIGDDRLQQQSRGRVVPDAFTHGTSQQRMYWFKKGFETGDVNQGNTFKELASLYRFHAGLKDRLGGMGVAVH